MSTGRHDARRTALDILYQADVTGESAMVVLAEWKAAGREIPEFAIELVTGVSGDESVLDEVIDGAARDWSVERMAAVDRTILRVAVYELRSRPDVPTGAAIDEAVQAAKELSTEDSGSFVNGILGRIARESDVRRSDGGEPEPRMSKGSGG